MSESVAPFRAPRAPDLERGGLPRAQPLPESWLRPSRLRRVALLTGVLAAIFIAPMPLTFGGHPLLGFAVIIAVGAGIVSVNRRFNRRTGEAGRLLLQGKVDEGEREFERLAHAWGGGRRAIAHSNLAEACLMTGKPERALALYQAAHFSGGLRLTNPSVRQSVPFLIAIIYAVLGDPPAARAWVSEAARSVLMNNLRYDLAADAFILAREKDYAKALDLLEGSWIELEGTFNSGMMRSLRVLRAFVAASSGDISRGNALTESAKPFLPGEYAWLGGHWPEMQAFLSEHSLA